MEKVEKAIESDGWISIKKELPPFDVPVKVRGSDFMGYFYLSHPVSRKQYKQPNKRGNKGWRWVDAYGERLEDSDNIDAWKPTTN